MFYRRQIRNARHRFGSVPTVMAFATTDVKVQHSRDDDPFISVYPRKSRWSTEIGMFRLIADC